MLMTCIVALVLVNSEDIEYVETKPLVCEVLKMSPVYDEFSPGYRHIKVNCKKGIDNFRIAKNISNKPIRWLSTETCHK